MPGTTLKLTAREREILELMCRGLTDARIADALGLSPHTVRNHLASVYRKLRVHRRSAAVIWGYQQGFRNGPPNELFVDDLT